MLSRFILSAIPALYRIYKMVSSATSTLSGFFPYSSYYYVLTEHQSCSLNKVNSIATHLSRVTLAMSPRST